MLSRHDQFSVELAGYLPVQPLCFLIAREYRHDRTRGVGRPSAAFDAPFPDRDSRSDLLASHRHPGFVHVHDGERVWLERLLSDEPELAPADIIRIKHVEPAF